MVTITREKSLAKVLTILNENNLLIHDVLYVEGLKHNLLSISQLCDRGYQVTFRTNSCEIRLPNSKDVLLIGKRSNNIYLLDISISTSIGCLLSKQEESWLWHRRIAHIHMNHLNKLVSNELVHGLPDGLPMSSSWMFVEDGAKA